MKPNTISTANLEIEGIILTPAAIEMLRAFQTDNNEHLIATSETLAGIVCFIGSLLDTLEGENHRQATEIINNLSHLRNDLNKLRA